MKVKRKNYSRFDSCKKYISKHWLCTHLLQHRYKIDRKECRYNHTLYDLTTKARMAAYCICISVQNILTYKVLASVSVKPLALLSILWAATEYPNSSVSTPRTGENLTMGLNVSMVLKEATALYNSSRHRPVATDLSIVLHRARQNVEMSKKIIRNGISTRYGISGMWMWLRIINRACSATINQ